MFYQTVSERYSARARELEALYRSRDRWDTIPVVLRDGMATDCRFAETLQHAQLYYLEIEHVNELKDLALDTTAFPRCPYPVTWVEFNAGLAFDYQFVMTKLNLDTRPPSWTSHRLDPPTVYRAVLFQQNENYVCATWIGLIGADGLCPRFHVVFFRDAWPNRRFVSTFSRDGGGLEGDDASWVDEENAHHERLYRASVNLLHFLMSENMVFVRIRPENRGGPYGPELRALPRCDKPYRIVSFQAPRYRYLAAQKKSETQTGERHLRSRHDVRAFFRHLRADRYGRDPDGNVRTVYVRSHQRGLLSDTYKPSLRVGHVGARLLDYDVFVRELESDVSNRGKVHRYE